jgi:L-aspartate oxidase
VVFARRAAEAAGVRVPAAVGSSGAPMRGSRQPLREPRAAESGGLVSGAELPGLMWDACGLERDADGLRDALGRLGDGSASHQHAVARLMCEAALLREESRGAHYRADHPEADDAWLGHIVLRRDEPPEFERTAD